jgi:predicted NACHT family NTPase
LLSQIARNTFEAGNYFFKQREVERYISQYIQNLPDASTDSEALELDSAAVLKSIEAQHGLLVERARGIYSFSHLTFHEYFTARKIVTSCNPYAADDPTLQGLVSHLTEKRWREVFLLTVGMLDSADVLLRLMKVRVDRLLGRDNKLHRFLRWVQEKSISINSNHNLSIIRAFYFSLEIYLSGIKGKNQSLMIGYDHQEFNVEDITNSLMPGCIEIPTDKFLRSTNKISSNKNELDEMIFDSIYIRALSSGDSNLLTQSYKLLGKYSEKKVESNSVDIVQEFSSVGWWNINWIETVKILIVEHRNIGHDWQFSDEQKQLLQQYYDANKLLVDCLNNDCYVSREVRQEIEETLLLPIVEIEKWQQQEKP